MLQRWQGLHRWGMERQRKSSRQRGRNKKKTEMASRIPGIKGIMLFLVLDIHGCRSGVAGQHALNSLYFHLKGKFIKKQMWQSWPLTHVWSYICIKSFKCNAATKTQHTGLRNKKSSDLDSATPVQRKLESLKLLIKLLGLRFCHFGHHFMESG